MWDWLLGAAKTAGDFIGGGISALTNPDKPAAPAAPAAPTIVYASPAPVTPTTPAVPSIREEKAEKKDNTLLYVGGGVGVVVLVVLLAFRR